MSTNQRTETVGPLQGVVSGAFSTSVQPESAGQTSFPRTRSVEFGTTGAALASELSSLRRRATTASTAGFLRTHRVDADPTDKG